MDRARIPVVIGYGLIVFGAIMSVALWARPDNETPYLADSPVDGTRFHLRLLKISDQPFRYRWKVPRWFPLLPAQSPPGDESWPGDIDISFGGANFGQNTLPAVGLLFRYVDEHGDWAAPWEYPSVRFVESNGWIHRPNGFNKFDSDACLVTTSSLPRRDPTLAIEWKSQGQLRTATATIDVANPFYRSDFPEWDVQPLPQTQVRGDLTVELLRLRSNRYDHGAVVTARDSTGAWMLPENQHDNQDVLLEDATGNVGRILSPFEPAWKVVVPIFRKPEASHAPEHVHTIGSFRIPNPGKVIPIDRTIPMAKGVIRIHCVAGAGTVRLDRGALTTSTDLNPHRDADLTGPDYYGWASHPQPFLWVCFDETPSDRKLVLRCRAPTKEPLDTTLDNTLDFRLSKVIPLPSATLGSVEIEISLIECVSERFEFFVAPPQDLRDEASTDEYRSAMNESW